MCYNQKRLIKVELVRLYELEVPASGRLAPYKWFQPLKIFCECRQTVEDATRLPPKNENVASIFLL